MCLPNCPFCSQGNINGKKPFKQKTCAKSRSLNILLIPTHGGVGAVVTGKVKKRNSHPQSEAEKKLFLEKIYPL